MLPVMASAMVAITGRLAQLPARGSRALALRHVVREAGFLGPAVLSGLAGLAHLDHPASSTAAAGVERRARGAFHVGTLQEHEVVVGDVLRVRIVGHRVGVTPLGGSYADDLVGGRVAVVPPFADGEGAVTDDAVAVGSKPRDPPLRENARALGKLGVLP